MVIELFLITLIVELILVVVGLYISIIIDVFKISKHLKLDY